MDRQSNTKPRKLPPCEKGDLPEHFSRTFSLVTVMPFLHESEHTKLMSHDLSDYQLIVGNFLPGITFM